MREISLFKKCSGPAGFVFSPLLVLLLIIPPSLQGMVQPPLGGSEPLGLGDRPPAPGNLWPGLSAPPGLKVQQCGCTETPVAQVDSQAGGCKPDVGQVALGKSPDLSFLSSKINRITTFYNLTLKVGVQPLHIISGKPGSSRARDLSKVTQNLHSRDGLDISLIPGCASTWKHAFGSVIYKL